MERLPAGPSRMRVGDRDRERVVALIRAHWSEGRLSDEELEQRLAQTLSARTLGELRGLVGDLPSPPPSTRERALRAVGSVGRGGSRTVVWVLATAGAVVALAALGAAAPEEERDRAGGTPPPRAQSPPPFSSSEQPAPKVTRARIGEAVEDDGVVFVVRRVGRRSTVPLRADRDGGAYAAGENRRLVVADLELVNRRPAPVDPFCGSGGAALRVSAGEEVEPINQLYQLEGNQSVCSDGIPPNGRADVRIAFRVPAGDRAERLDVYNADDDADRLGKTRIRIRL